MHCARPSPTRKRCSPNSHANKSEVRIYDYVDSQVPMLARMFERRQRGYRAIGYSTGEISGL